MHKMLFFRRLRRHRVPELSLFLRDQFQLVEMLNPLTSIKVVVNDRRVLCPIAKKYTVIELNSIGCVNHRAGSKNQFRNTSRVSEFDVETIYFSLD